MPQEAGGFRRSVTISRQPVPSEQGMAAKAQLAATADASQDIRDLRPGAVATHWLRAATLSGFCASITHYPVSPSPVDRHIDAIDEHLGDVRANQQRRQCSGAAPFVDQALGDAGGNDGVISGAFALGALGVFDSPPTRVAKSPRPAAMSTRGKSPSVEV
jgi:hypothetical protein